MSRSRKKNPVSGITKSKSDKFYKKTRQSKERRTVRDKLKIGDFDDLHNEQVAYNDWVTDKDGKKWWGYDNDYIEKIMRK